LRVHRDGLGSREVPLLRLEHAKRTRAGIEDLSGEIAFDVTPRAFAIDRPRRGENDPLGYGVVTLQRVEHGRRPDDVHLGMSRRLGQRLAGAGLGREVDDDIRPTGGQEILPGGGVRDILLVEVRSRVESAAGQTVGVDLRMQVVERDHPLEGVSKVRGKTGSDEAGASGDDDEPFFGHHDPPDVKISA